MEPILKRFKGFTPNKIRQDYLLLGLTEISLTEYVLMDCIKYVCVDWDWKHDRHQTFDFADVLEAINYLDWGEEKVMRVFRNLRKYGMVILVDPLRKRYRLYGDVFQHDIFCKVEDRKQDDPFFYTVQIAKKYNLEYYKHNPNDKKVKDKVKKVNLTSGLKAVLEAKDSSIYKSSFKKGLGVSNTSRSEEDYKKLAREYKTTPEDIKDIEESVEHSTPIKNNKN
jgi:hypothetical protein